MQSERRDLEYFGKGLSERNRGSRAKRPVVDPVHRCVLGLDRRPLPNRVWVPLASINPDGRVKTTKTHLVKTTLR